MTEPLPTFRYHPDPVATGAIGPSDEVCRSCEGARGFAYEGGIHSADFDEGALCPWCIADGSAARRFDGDLNDVGTAPPGIAEPVLDEIANRTPGFPSWQQERWLFHCGDGAAYLGTPSGVDLLAYPDARDALLHENDEFGWSPEESEAYVDGLHPEGEAVAYLFRCLHCGTHLAYSDMS